MLDPLLGLWLAIHLLSVDLAMAAPMVMMVMEWRSRRDPAAAALLPKLGFLSVKTLTLGALTGLVHGYLLWSDSYAQVILATGSRWKASIGEFAFSFILILLCWIWQKRAARSGNTSVAGPRWRAFLLFLAGTNLIYHFPLFFEILAYLRREGAPETALTSAEFRALLVQPEITSRALHVILSGFAVTGVVLAWMTERRWASASEEERPAWRTWYRTGIHLACWPTFAQAIVGTWVALTYSRAGLMRMAGGELGATLAVIASAITILGLLHILTKALISRDIQRFGARAGVVMAAVVWAMCWLAIAAAS